MSDERRQLARYPAHHLKVKILSRYSDRHSEGELFSLDFNRQGMSLESDELLAVGESLSLQLSTHDGLKIEVPAVVCNRCKSQQNFRFGLAFNFEASNDAHIARRKMTALEQGSSDVFH